VNELNQKKIKILDAVEELILKKGDLNVSVREIAAQAEINIAMISYYFGSKNKMMQLLYENKIRKTKEKFSLFTQTISMASPATQMREIINFIVSQLSESYFFHGFTLSEHSSPAREKYIWEFNELCVQKFEELIQKGIAVGEFHRAVRPEDILATIIGTIIFCFRQKDFYKTFLPSRDDSDFIAHIQDRLQNHVSHTIFSLLTYQPEG